MMEFELEYEQAMQAKKAADKNLAIAKFKYDLSRTLTDTKLLSPDTRRRIVSNMDIGYLIQAQDSVCSNDWSAYADADAKDIATLKNIGNVFLPAYNKLTA